MATDVLRNVTHVLDTVSPEQNAMLDRWADQLQGLVRTAVDQGGPAARRLKNWLNGVWLGHALHPALTDVPVGAWTTGAVARPRCRSSRPHPPGRSGPRSRRRR